MCIRDRIERFVIPGAGHVGKKLLTSEHVTGKGIYIECPAFFQIEEMCIRDRQLRDSLLLLPEFFSVPISQGFRQQGMIVEIEVPQGKKIEIDERPVSYTHLDVYKRQPIFFWIQFP